MLCFLIGLAVSLVLVWFFTLTAVVYYWLVKGPWMWPDRPECYLLTTSIGALIWALLVLLGGGMWTLGCWIRSVL